MAGRVDFGTRSAQATLGEVANAATVSLIDAVTGNTVSSSLTDASGSFVLTFNNFTPVAGTPYVLEAVKGLSAGGTANRVGASAARLRTLLFWNNGWQSLTNSTAGTGIVVSAATTAIATISSLKQLTVPTMLQLVNSVSGSSFTDGKGGLSSANDFQPVLTLVSNSLTLDQDPVGQIAYDASSGTYSLPTGVPAVASITPTIPTPGQTLTVHGAYFDPNPGRLSFWFGAVSAATYSVSTDRTTVTVTIPGSAYSAPFTMQQPGGVVQTLSPFLFLHGTVGTIAGNGSGGGVNGTGINAEFSGPLQILPDPSGLFYLRDLNNSVVRIMAPGGVVSTFVDSSGSPVSLAHGGLALDPAHNFVVTLNNSNTIVRVTPSGVTSLIAGSGTAGYADGNGAAASMNYPHTPVVDASGNIYFTDYANHAIRRIDTSGNVTTLAGSYSISLGTRSPVSGWQDGTGTSAMFNNPNRLAFGPDGNLYVSEYGNNDIRRVTLSGVVTTVAGSASASPGSVDGVGTNARFNLPHGITLDSGGNIYVCEYSGQKIRRISPTGVVTTVAGNGVAAYADGSTTSAEFSGPSYISLDSLGNLYVADRNTNRFRVITP